MSLVTVTDAEVVYRRGRQLVRAVAGASLSVERGEVVGLVGESGCGKSTLAKAVLGLVPLESGSVEFEGRPVQPLGRGAREQGLRGMQMVFQDPYSSLNPRRRVGDQVADGIELGAGRRLDAAGRRRRVGELLERVGLPTDFARRFPHEFSGGQRQRIAIARALAAEPRLIVADEAISALDVSAQASIANLLASLAADLDVGLLFISHDLGIVRQLSDRIAVMYLGKVVETGPADTVWGSPAHPYARALIGAIPSLEAGRLPDDLPGDVPDPAAPPTGCRFHPRCPRAFAPCPTSEPSLLAVEPGHAAACHLHTHADAPASDTVVSAPRGGA
ncbi:peptide/nickel transport system ATP-binding protein [Terracoccus luteus]|jgi:oligopeptide/dipeptide ABC transporter ATP-binding protein|uniref:Peptide/nickel transport system ATP-binding protein n=1 Tax=Terracoccus luteus TaxID=53356 RepID=A0A495XXD5_9MICO|nr:ABC transporter ATP-binding protein [Terracoccus luteus]RKT78937.1 peptide/nickel transport system ATP-binding protein [Terracoccus luteus]